MTNEEAIKILHPDTTLMALAEVEYFGGFNGEEAKIKAVEEACVIACEALAKQMPKKPIRREAEDYFSGVTFVICPNCEKKDFGVMRPHCCDKCGQVIDWSD